MVGNKNSGRKKIENSRDSIVHIRVSKELYNQFNAYCKSKERSMSYIGNKLLKVFMMTFNE